MCGIAGFIDYKHSSDDRQLERMVKQLNHRGPDSRGTKIIELDSARIGLGHARLSIIDLSPLGHQPMAFEHLDIVFNGEIYNYQEVRDELSHKGRSFRTNSDTEVILQAYDEWGSQCVNKFIGMFVFAIVDTKNLTMEFFRDRAGVKPLFLYLGENVLLFASELKSFHEHPAFSKQINRQALHGYLNSGTILGSQSIFEKVEKLKPGSHLHIDLRTGKKTYSTYWGASSFLNEEMSSMSYEDAVEELHSLLISACKYRMVSDVPVGVFLSGGYDSTAVASILASHSAEQIKTFTIGFEVGNNEAPFALETAKRLGTDHHEYTCTTREAQEIIPNLPFYFDEPFADSSAIPTILVSQFARKKVTVALSADGGDELFAGYTRYQDVANHFSRLKKMGMPGKLAMQVVGSLGGGMLALKYRHQIESAVQSRGRKNDAEAFKLLYDVMHRIPKQYHNLLVGTENYRAYEASYEHMGVRDLRNYPLLHDFTHYLPDDILTKVDRATMSVSLEGREPLLDHRLFEFAAKLPYEYKSNGTHGKRILKEVVHKYVPADVMERPKTGFSIPLTHWFKTDLRPLLHDTLAFDNVKRAGMMDPHVVQKIVRDFDNDKLHYKPLIWKMLMLQMWADKWTIS